MILTFAGAAAAGTCRKGRLTVLVAGLAGFSPVFNRLDAIGFTFRIEGFLGSNL